MIINEKELKNEVDSIILINMILFVFKKFSMDEQKEKKNLLN